MNRFRLHLELSLLVLPIPKQRRLLNPPISRLSWTQFVENVYTLPWCALWIIIWLKIKRDLISWVRSIVGGYILPHFHLLRDFFLMILLIPCHLDMDFFLIVVVISLKRYILLGCIWENWISSWFCIVYSNSCMTRFCWLYIFNLGSHFSCETDSYSRSTSWSTTCSTSPIRLVDSIAKRWGSMRQSPIFRCSLALRGAVYLSLVLMLLLKCFASRQCSIFSKKQEWCLTQLSF